MSAEEFLENQIKLKGDYGLCPPPTTSDECLKVLSEHFLGKNWISLMPMSKEQVNTEIVIEILLKNQPKKWYQRLFNP